MSRPVPSTDALAAALLAASVLSACAGWRDRPASTDARGVYYSDNSGVSVITAVAGAEQPLTRSALLSVRVLVDHITLTRKPLDPGDPGANGQPTGHPHHDPDAVSSASATAGGGAVQTETRLEAVVAGAWDTQAAGRPVTVRASARGSREPDYRSLSGALSATVELAHRNVALSGFLGYGTDDVLPVEAPPGQDALWPAEHHRVTAGASFVQLLSPDVTVSAAVALTAQRGVLSNPYRRALVRTSLFPELVPSARDRTTAYFAVSWYVGADTALHLRDGLYRDSWGVLAFVPEVALVHALRGGRGLAALRYRYYRQWEADFYRARYPDLEPLMTGDARLGPLRDHTLGLDARWLLRGTAEDTGSLALTAGYELSLTDYEELATATIMSHTAVLGLSLWY